MIGVLHNLHLGKRPWLMVSTQSHFIASSRGVKMNEGLAAAPDGEGDEEKEGEEGESEDPLLDLVMSDIMGLGEEPVQSLEEVLR